MPSYCSLQRGCLLSLTFFLSNLTWRTSSQSEPALPAAADRKGLALVTVTAGGQDKKLLKF